MKVKSVNHQTKTIIFENDNIWNGEIGKEIDLEKLELQEKNKALELTLAEAIKCIKFYANWSNYKQQKITELDCELVHFHDSPSELIGGMLARDFLNKSGI